MRTDPLVTALLRQKPKVLNLRQNSPEWLETRKHYRTASESSIVLGLSPWSTPSQLAIEKFGNGVSKSNENIATRHGHINEPKARRAWEAQFGQKMPPTCVVRGDYMASLDGFSKDRRSVIEIKCPFTHVYSDTWIMACDDKLPDHYYAQCQHQLMVSGAEVCHFWVWDTRRCKGIGIDVYPDLKCYARIVQAWEEFVKKYA